MQVKICCIQSVAEAELVLHYGATAVGLVGPMPSGPGAISINKMAEIARWCRGKIETFLLTSETKSSQIIEQHRMAGTTTIQLVDYLETHHIQRVREELPEIKIVPVIHVLSERDLKLAQQYSEWADMLLLDSGNPNLSTKKLGGTGTVHDWGISANIVKKVDKPIWLAGGLSGENVNVAIRIVRPAGVDVCSGVRTGGVLDEEKLRSYFSAIEAGRDQLAASPV